MSKLEFRTNGKIVGRWEVTFTQKDHAYLQCEAMNVGTEWPIVRGQQLYSTFHFYLLDGRWTCHHPYIRRVGFNMSDPTKHMINDLTNVVEAQFHDWAIQQQEAIKTAELEHLQNCKEKLENEIADLQDKLNNKKAELGRTNYQIALL